MLAQSRSNLSSLLDHSRHRNRSLKLSDNLTSDPNRHGQPFNPFKRFTGTFIPEDICRYRGLSPNAKLVYGRLCRFAGEHGKAYPSVATLGAESGMGVTEDPPFS